MAPSSAKQKTDPTLAAALRRLAALHGVQPSYVDASGTKITIGHEALTRVVEGCGSACSTVKEATESEHRFVAELQSRRLEPVTVAWIGRRNHALLALDPAKPAKGRVEWSLSFEEGGSTKGSADLASLAVKKARGTGGLMRTCAAIPLPKDLPAGYHTLHVKHGGASMSSRLIAAPMKSYRHPAGEHAHAWGVFCPLYSIRSERNMGVGDFTDMQRLVRWSRSLGGHVAATLPMLATFLGERPGPYDRSPYAPISKLFWNELFVDPTRAPDFSACEGAVALVESAEFKKLARALREAPLVDYRAAAGLKRRVLEPLAEAFFGGGGEKSTSFKSFLAESPLAREYAMFRAVTERRGESWGAWPAKLQRGSFSKDDADPTAARYHLYAQYLTWMELLALGSELKASGGLLYLDLPVGVSPFGFDTFKNRRLFAPCSTGAPPDPYFTGGQNWGFPPMHPEACRADGYAYLIATLRSHMRHAEYLRLDHVMAFYRLFWIPDGMTAADGTYVRYHEDELWAILCIESHRNRCRLVGENLGTVPPQVNKALDAHDFCGLYVGQYEMQPKSPALRPVPSNCVASVNTHDMAPLATTLSGADIEDRIGLGMLSPALREREEATRDRVREALIALLRKKKLMGSQGDDARSIRDGLLAFLGDSPADFLLVNLEDLWLETKWQNVPGTVDEHPNWRRKLALTLDEIELDGSIRTVLERVDAARRGKPLPRADDSSTRKPAKKPVRKAAAR